MWWSMACPEVGIGVDEGGIMFGDPIRGKEADQANGRMRGHLMKCSNACNSQTMKGWWQ